MKKKKKKEKGEGEGEEEYVVWWESRGGIERPNDKNNNPSSNCDPCHQVQMPSTEYQARL